MRIISIDPGYERMGVAVIEKTDGKEHLVFSECFRTSPKIPHAERLKFIGKEVESVVKKYKPEALAIETLFFSKNQKTALQVSEARGVILYIVAANDIPVKEFSPADIKIAVTGHGGSDKKQVTFMVKKLVKVGKEIKYDDECDAIAAGLTFFAHQR